MTSKVSNQFGCKKLVETVQWYYRDDHSSHRIVFGSLLAFHSTEIDVNYPKKVLQRKANWMWLLLTEVEYLELRRRDEDKSFMSIFEIRKKICYKVIA